VLLSPTFVSSVPEVLSKSGDLDLFAAIALTMLLERELAMQKQLLLIGFALSMLLYNGVQNAGTAAERSQRILAADELQRLLTGNTLKGYDDNGPFWLYYADRTTIWGQASNGDVDIGTWWIQDGRYCRMWRRWFGGATQCWTLALQGNDPIIIWLGDGEQRLGGTTLEHGNSLGRGADSQLFATAADPRPVHRLNHDASAITVRTAPVIATPEMAEPAATVTTVHLRVTAGLAPEQRQRIEAALAQAGYGTVVVNEVPFSISRSRVGYFRKADRGSAEALIVALRGTHDVVELRDYSTLIATPEPGRLDLWIRS
jgi:hypothetical protein